MNSTEYMIGDWVMCKTPRGAVVKIAGLEEGGHITKYRLQNGDMVLTCESVEDFLPIPLTKEILHNNFHTTKDDLFWEPGLSFGYWEVMVDKPSVKITAVIAHVHELQHILCLCGIEKEVVL